MLDEQVEGDIDKGVVNAHLVKLPGEHNYQYRYLFLDVAGALPHHIFLFLVPPLILSTQANPVYTLKAQTESPRMRVAVRRAYLGFNGGGKWVLCRELNVVYMRGPDMRQIGRNEARCCTTSARSSSKRRGKPTSPHFTSPHLSPPKGWD